MEVAKNTKFQRGDGAGVEVFTTVPGVYEIGEIGTETALIESMDYDSDIKDFENGIKEGKEITVSMRRITGDVQQDALRDDAAAGARRNIKVVFQKDETEIFETADFECIVRDFTTTSPKEERRTSSVILKITTIPVWS